jgi:spore coat polysaccharide biosynthesis predicted glycosyltransferase SpsG
VMRSLALAEELRRRGVDVVFVCDSHTVPWAHEQIVSRGIPVEPAVWTPAEHVKLVEDVDAVVFDSYDLDTEVFRAVRQIRPTLAIVDGDLRGAEADVFVDQNLGSELDTPELPAGATRLAGLDYVLLRDEVLEHRPDESPATRRTDRPRVFAFFGGTDAFGAGPPVVGALAATGVPFEAIVVAPRDDLVERIRAVPLGPGQRVEPIGPTTRLAEAARAADLVISASGTSTWELFCLGASTALVCVVDNQVLGYERAVATNAAAGIGTPQTLNVDLLRTLLTDQELRTRLAQAGWRLVDGLGRRRVADALLELSSNF